MENWEKLEHAYGSAANIPGLLSQLSSFPEEGSYEDEPWFSLWSALYHQGDIYSASLAAVPEIVRVLSGAPGKATFSFFALPASIEIARVRAGTPFPAELEPIYHAALKELAVLAAHLPGSGADPIVSQAAIAAFAVAVGQYEYAELVLEISPEEVPEILEQYREA